MLRTPAFEGFVAPATRYPAIWRIFVASVFGFVTYLVGAMALIFMLAEPLLGVAPTINSMESIFFQVEQGDTPMKMAMLLATFIPMALAAVVMALWHWRGPATLFGNLKNFWPNFVKAALVIIALNALYFIYDQFFGVEALLPNLPFGIWAKHLLWAVPLLFVQITAEEMVFRGYLQQQLAARLRHPIWWMILPSVLFGIGHFNPEIDPKLAYLIVLATTLFGLIAADITRVTGSLAAAMGLHFANNFFAILVVGVPGELSGLALFHTPFGMEQTDIFLPFVILDMIILVIVWAIIRRIVR